MKAKELEKKLLETLDNSNVDFEDRIEVLISSLDRTIRMWEVMEFREDPKGNHKYGKYLK